jgi:sugar phosphate isomerase/epimerase
MNRLHRIHVKGTRNRNNVFWGNLYATQLLDADLAKRAGVPVAQNEWDRHNYEATLPGFGGSDSIDWRAFVNVLKERSFKGPFEIENEAALSKQTGNLPAIVQGYKATVLNLSPLLWPLTENGYQYDQKGYHELKSAITKDIPITTMDQLM